MPRARAPPLGDSGRVPLIASWASIRREVIQGGVSLTSMPDDRQVDDKDEDFLLEGYATTAVRRALRGGTRSN